MKGKLVLLERTSTGLRQVKEIIVFGILSEVRKQAVQDALKSEGWRGDWWVTWEIPI